GEERIVADRLYALLSNPPRKDAPEAPPAPRADLSGSWDVSVEYAAGRSNHVLQLRQRGNEIDGSHQGDFISRDLSGSIDGDTVRLRSNYGEEHGDALGFTFSGQVAGDELSGAQDMGEYLAARWTPKRRVRRRA